MGRRCFGGGNLCVGIDKETNGMDPKRSCEILLFDHLHVDKSRVQFGLTKLFMKETEVRYPLLQINLQKFQ